MTQTPLSHWLLFTCILFYLTCCSHAYCHGLMTQTGNAFLFSDGESVKSGYNPNQRECYLFFVTGGFLSVTVISSSPQSPSCLTGGQHYPQDNSINHKNYNDFLNCDWFKKLLFPTNSLAKLLSDSL